MIKKMSNNLGTKSDKNKISAEYKKSASKETENNEIIINILLNNKLSANEVKIYLMIRNMQEVVLADMEYIVEKITQEVIATRLGTHQPIVSRIIDKLVSIGIVERTKTSNKKKLLVYTAVCPIVAMKLLSLH
jgi:DNA-binding MarR family transcriptional regulator